MNVTETNGSYFVTEAYPSLKEPTPVIFLVSAIYLFCFIFGICGNASTLTLIFGFGTESQKTVPKIGQVTHDRFKVYVACLCFVDSLMLLSLPPTIVDALIGFWIFGDLACKFHHFCSTIGRLASTLIITSLSVERYLAVISPHRFGNRSRRTTALIMFFLLSVAAILLLPLILFAKAERVFLFESRQSSHVVHVRIHKCVDSMPEALLFWFTLSTFVVGYFLPIILISTFNIKLLLQIRRHQRKLSTKKSIIPTKTVTRYIVLIATCYFICWSPYWTGVLYTSYIDLFGGDIKTLTNKSETIIILLYLTHCFPYMNASVNWLLYGRLARNLTTQQSTSTLYRNGAVTSYTQSEVSWNRKQTIDDGPIFFGSAPTQQLLLRSIQSDPVASVKVTNGRSTAFAPNQDEDIESF